jgi:hypothetical protein
LYIEPIVQDLRYVQCCYGLEIMTMDYCISVGFKLIHVRRFGVTMASSSEQFDRSPMRMSSTHRLLSTPVVSDDDSGLAVQNIVTLVTQACLDPLMRASLYSCMHVVVH